MKSKLDTREEILRKYAAQIDLHERQKVLDKFPVIRDGKKEHLDLFVMDQHIKRNRLRTI